MCSLTSIPIIFLLFHNMRQILRSSASTKKLISSLHIHQLFQCIHYSPSRHDLFLRPCFLSAFRFLLSFFVFSSVFLLLFSVLFLFVKYMFFHVLSLTKISCSVTHLRLTASKRQSKGSPWISPTILTTRSAPKWIKSLSLTKLFTI